MWPPWFSLPGSAKKSVTKLRQQVDFCYMDRCGLLWISVTLLEESRAFSDSCEWQDKIANLYIDP